MGKIKILDTNVANKIAAGEIIERPVSVIKELLENSLDANATFIEVIIKAGGMELIKVTDNGSGMEKEDALIAFERHATSKINNEKDLFNITTFGFRGEALPSIGAIAQVVLTTSSQSSSVGTRVKIIGGKQLEVEEIAFSTGTAIEVRNLFFNIPARRKFVKNLSYETGLITELISRYSLGHPNVRFRLVNGREIQFDSAGMNSLIDRLSNIYGHEIGESFIKLDKTEFIPNYFVTAWLAPGKFNRNTRSQQTFFINGRLIKSIELNKLLDETYHTLIPKGRFPLALIDLTIPGDQLDVNIHPAKLQIKINTIEKIITKLSELFKEKLWNTSSIEQVKDQPRTEIITTNHISDHREIVDEVDHNVDETKLDIDKSTFEAKKYSSASQDNKDDYFFETTPQYTQGFLNLRVRETPIKTNKNIDLDNKSADVNTDKIGTLNTTYYNKKVTVKNIKELEPIAQINNSFILAKNQDGLYIIDQHTCHERILYEKFMSEEDAREVISEDLLIPHTLHLSGEQEGILIKCILILKELGFIIENFGPRTYIIRSVPVGFKMDNQKQIFLDLLEELSYNANISRAKIKETIITMAACKGAVKAKQSLTQEEIIYLLRQLAEVKNANTCPHGRPIFYHLSMSDLYKIFKRGEYRGE